MAWAMGVGWSVIIVHVFCSGGWDAVVNMMVNMCFGIWCGDLVFVAFGKMGSISFWNLLEYRSVSDALDDVHPSATSYDVDVFPPAALDLEKDRG
jgi:hypothetical protein